MCEVLTGLGSFHSGWETLDMNTTEIKREITIALRNRLSKFREQYDANAKINQVSIKSELDNIVKNHTWTLNEEWVVVSKRDFRDDEEFQERNKRLFELAHLLDADKKLILKLAEECKREFQE
jgi:hypothetical protein